MTNSNTKEQHVVSPEQVTEALEKDYTYTKLLDKYNKQMKSHQYVQSMQTRLKMDERMREVVEQMVSHEMNDRKKASDIVKMLGDEEGERYCCLLNALCMCFDVIDSIFVDINYLIKKSGTGYVAEDFPELDKCRKKINSVLGFEMKKMDKVQMDLYVEEADALYDHIKVRSEAFRKAVDKLSTDNEKVPQNG